MRSKQSWRRKIKVEYLKINIILELNNLRIQLSRAGENNIRVE
jgi:hypothetical protein